MLPIRLTTALLGASLAVALAVAACDAGTTGQDDSHATDAARCTKCQTTLADCSAASSSDAGFVACRDGWRQCLQTEALGAICVNPLDRDACELCRIDLTGCKDQGGSAACSSQFGTCKSRLMFRADLRASCGEQDDRPPEVSCGACQDELGGCLFDSAINTEEACLAGFDTCRGKAGLTTVACRKPVGEEGCALCTAEMQDCEAAGIDGCDGGFSRCRHALALGFTCEPPLPPEPPGSGGSSGTGGNDPGGCAHDPCDAGDALDIDCDECASEVCGQDEYCCTTAWDETCVEEATAIPICNCDGEPGDAPACVHDECAAGGALEAACSSCADSVCASDDFCCTVEWDSLCVGAAEGNAACACAPVTPECAHDPCDSGAALDAACDDCASEVCAGDSYCCDVEWDSLCVGAAEEAASCWCSGTEPQACAHDPCVSGAALDAACDDCASEVCAGDSYCCDTAWDTQCVGEAEQAASCWCN